MNAVLARGCHALTLTVDSRLSPRMDRTKATHSRRFRVEWVVVTILLLLMGVAIGAALLGERKAVTARESDRLQVQARVIDDNVIRQIQGVNNALAGIRNALERSEIAATGVSTAARLKLLADAMPGVRTVVIVDIRGVVVASSRPELLGLDASGRDYVMTPRKQPDREVLYVSVPFRSQLGPLVISIGRVLTNAHGDFAGVVLATLNPEYFEVALQSVLYAPDMRASLAHGDGQIFVTAPVNARVLGVNLAQPGSMFLWHQHSGQTATVKTGQVVVAGDDRMVALRTLNRADLNMDKPMVASVGREQSAIYLSWRNQALSLGLLYACIALTSIVGLHLGQQRRKKIHRLEADAAGERQRSADRLELALRGADLGLWDLHIATGNFVADPRERAMLGFSPDDALPQADAWRNLIHPDDRARVDAAAQPHASGQGEAYECEHRMLHKDGHYIWVASRGRIVERDANGRPLRIVGTHLDITERKRIGAELAQTAALLQHSQERLNLALEGSGLALFDWDIQTGLVYNSAQASAMRDESAVETTTSTAQCGSLVHPEDLDALRSILTSALKSEVPVIQVELRIRRRRGDWLWVYVRGRVVERDASGRALRLAGTYANINAAKLAEDRLRHRAEFDLLTDLPNRALFIERLRQAMARATIRHTVALLFLDIDHFKTVNDTLGHEAGDQLLKVFAARMRDGVRNSDTVARLAGDEFTVILEGLRGVEDACTLAGQLVELLRAPIDLGGKLFVITASVGVAMQRDGETDDAELLRRADLALYEAKRRGRDRFFCEEADETAGLAAPG